MDIIGRKDCSAFALYICDFKSFYNGKHIMRSLKMLTNVAMLLPTIELYVIIPTQSVESYMWTHEGL